MENEFSLAENEEIPVLKMQYFLSPLWFLLRGLCYPVGREMEPALGRQAVEFMIINLVSHDKIESIFRRRERLQ